VIRTSRKAPLATADDDSIHASTVPGYLALYHTFLSFVQIRILFLRRSKLSTGSRGLFPTDGTTGWASRGSSLRSSPQTGQRQRGIKTFYATAQQRRAPSPQFQTVCGCTPQRVLSDASAATPVSKKVFIRSYPGWTTIAVFLHNLYLHFCLYPLSSIVRPIRCHRRNSRMVWDHSRDSVCRRATNTLLSTFFLLKAIS
jgi:hypothetical protein